MLQINTLLGTRGKISKLMRIIVPLAMIMAATNVLAVGANYINPTEGKCNVELPPDAEANFWSNTDIKIHYTMSQQDGMLKATCHMVNHGFNLDKAIHFTGDDYNDDNSPFQCLVKIDGIYYYTQNFHATVTPSGNVKLTCTVDLDALSQPGRR